MDAINRDLKKRPPLVEEDGRFCDRLKIAIGNQTARKFAIDNGISTTALHQYLTGKSEPTRPVVFAIAKGAGVNLDWLITGHGPMRKGETLPTAIELGAFTITNFDGNQIEAALDPNLIHMPVLSLEAACGKGRYGDNAYITSMVSATNDWFRLKVRKDPRDMCLIHALGDSMAPLIEDGDMVFFDKTAKDRPCDGIWVFSYEERLFLKRLQFLPDSKIKVISSNAAYEPYVINIDESFRLFGRYVAVLGFRT